MAHDQPTETQRQIMRAIFGPRPAPKPHPTTGPVWAMYVRDIVWRHGPTPISWVHAMMYHGWATGPIGSDRLILNIHGGIVRVASAKLLMAPKLAEALARVADITILPMNLEFAFDIPIDPSDELDERLLDQYGPHRLGTAVFWDTYVRDYPARSRPDLVMVEPKIDEKERHLFDDVRDDWEFRDEDTGTCVGGVGSPVALSRKMIEAYGVVRSFGFFFAPRAYRLIAEFVENPYFVVFPIRG